MEKYIFLYNRDLDFCSYIFFKGQSFLFLCTSVDCAGRVAVGFSTQNDFVAIVADGFKGGGHFPRWLSVAFFCQDTADSACARQQQDEQGP